MDENSYETWNLDDLQNVPCGSSRENIYETWNLDDLQNVLCGFSSERITEARVKRLARYISYYVYENDDNDNPYNLNKIIKQSIVCMGKHRKKLVTRKDITAALEPLQQLFYINHDVLEHYISKKYQTLSVEVIRTVFLKLTAAVGTLIMRFEKEGGVVADNDWWSRESSVSK